MFICRLHLREFMRLTRRSEVPRLDVFVTRVENTETSILISLNAEVLLQETLGILEMLLGVNDIGIKLPWIGVDVWLLLSFSWIALEVHDIFIILTVISVTLWPGFLPVGSLVLHKVILVNSSNEIGVCKSVMMVVASVSS